MLGDTNFSLCKMPTSHEALCNLHGPTPPSPSLILQELGAFEGGLR